MKISQQTKNSIKWIEELQSGKHKQGRGQLGDLHQGFCCLGLACSLIIPNDYNPFDGIEYSLKDKLGLLEDTGSVDGVSDAMYQTEVTDIPTNVGDGQKRPYIKITNNKRTEYVACLTKANDDHKLSFRRIAGLLKRHPERFFIANVAKGVKKYFSK